MGEQVARRALDGSVLEWLDVPERAAALGLEPHPEGGWYRRTWTATDRVRAHGGTRPAATLILFFLPPGEASAWHRVESDEIWLWHGPDPLVLELGGAGRVPIEGDRRTLGLGSAPAPSATPSAGSPADLGHRPQVLVQAGVWQRTLPSEGEALVSCLVSPGFSFEDFTLAD